MNESTKPPIGLTPRAIHEEIVDINRVEDILRAMDRYFTAKKKFPEIWIDELKVRWGE